MAAFNFSFCLDYLPRVCTASLLVKWETELLASLNSPWGDHRCSIPPRSGGDVRSRPCGSADDQGETGESWGSRAGPPKEGSPQERGLRGTHALESAPRRQSPEENSPGGSPGGSPQCLAHWEMCKERHVFLRSLFRLYRPQN